MSQDRLNRLASLYVDRDIELDIDNVLDLFLRKHPRRLELLNILATDEENPDY